jgi:parvulin-like peptidyl-prolyl isomerase
MKGWIVGAVILAFSCAKKDADGPWTPETRAYKLASAVAVKVPGLDPATNKILATTRYFKITTATLFQTLDANLGSQADVIKEWDTDALRRLVTQNIESLAEQKILLRASQKSGVKIAKKNLDSLLNLQYQRTGGEQKFLEMIGQNGITLEQVKKNMTVALTIRTYLDRLSKITDSDIEAAHRVNANDTTVSVRHILLLTQDKSDAEKAAARKKMEQIAERLGRGGDFEKLAKQYSEDPGSRENGGFIDFFNRGTMVEPFEDMAFATPVGHISDIFETTYGYHILKVLDRKTESKTLGESRDQIRSQLEREKWNVLIPAHIDSLKKVALLTFSEF